MSDLVANVYEQATTSQDSARSRVCWLAAAVIVVPPVTL